MEDNAINFHQIIESSNSYKWIHAMNKEMKSMKTIMYDNLSHCQKWEAYWLKKDI